jgi:pimeloyl-ACP methyl ester carboxylesterase
MELANSLTPQASDQNYILFAQHGWADNNQMMLALAADLAPPAVRVIAPSLNYGMTWLRIAPLIADVEQLAVAVIEQQAHLPLRIIGHSMGGLIWLEVLHRHRQWWPRVESLVLLASPVGGADLGRLIDPFGWGVGIAADLGQDRRPLATELAAGVRTLVLAGDVDGGSDGTIPVESTKVPGAQFQVLKGLNHPTLRHHPRVVEAIAGFWAAETPAQPLTSCDLIDYLRRIPGMTDAHRRGFDQAQPYLTSADGLSLRIWHHPLAIDHVYVASAQGDCLYAGYVGWRHRQDLHQALAGLSPVDPPNSRVEPGG